MKPETDQALAHKARQRFIAKLQEKLNELKINIADLEASWSLLEGHAKLEQQQVYVYAYQDLHDEIVKIERQIENL